MSQKLSKLYALEVAQQCLAKRKIHDWNILNVVNLQKNGSTFNNVDR